MNSHFRAAVFTNFPQQESRKTQIMCHITSLITFTPVWACCTLSAHSFYHYHVRQKR